MTTNSTKPASPAVQKYWDAVSKRLRIESQEMAGLISHLGERGRANEGSIRNLLSNVLPPAVRVSSGEVIDSLGTASAQMDTLVLSNTLQPVLFAQTEELIFPVESVLICLEVKSTLTKAEVTDIAKKVRKHRNLHSAIGTKPVFGVFAHKAGSSPTTVANWFFETDPDDRPAFFLVNDSAIFGVADPTWEAGYQVVMPFKPLEGEDETYAAGDPAVSDVHYWKPIAGPQGDHVRIDHGAAMLLFIRAILKALTEQGHAEIEWLASYLDKISSKRVQFQKDSGSTLEDTPLS